MIDPFQEKFGPVVGGLMVIPAVLGEFFWSSAVLSALGATVSVVVGLGRQLSVIVSSCIVVSYTLIGGLYSVAYTDILQLLAMFIGLVSLFRIVTQCRGERSSKQYLPEKARFSLLRRLLLSVVGLLGFL